MDAGQLGVRPRSSGGRVVARRGPLGEVDLAIGQLARPRPWSGRGSARLTARGTWARKSVRLKVWSSEKSPLSKMRMKWRSAGPRPLDRVAVPAREVPDVTGAEGVHRRGAVGVHDRGPARAADHEGPFGRVGVPMELAQAARGRVASRPRRCRWRRGTRAPRRPGSRRRSRSSEPAARGDSGRTAGRASATAYAARSGAAKLLGSTPAPGLHALAQSASRAPLACSR